MEAANRGAHEAGGKTSASTSACRSSRAPTPTSRDGLHFEFHYFFMRKFWFAYLAKALVVFPGGFGTLDELFEILTLVQTDKLSKQIADRALRHATTGTGSSTLEPMAEWGAIGPDDPSCCSV